MSESPAVLTAIRRGLRVPDDWREWLRPHAPDALASRLLILTAVFTAAVEIMIVAPSAASFHERWLLDRLQSAELASVGVEALPYSRPWSSATRASAACCCRPRICRARRT
jgi:hypothetical protein